MTLTFGTDGVRGVANSELTPELVLALGRATARVFRPARVVIGRDTRRSGPLLEAALVAGLTAEGVDVELLGVVPTPAVAWTSAAEACLGAMLSASHNPFPDNGIKLFRAGGRKLTDDDEAALEAALSDLAGRGATGTSPTGAAVGRVTARPDARDAYVAAVAATLEGRRLDGLHVVVDAANGAAFQTAPAALTALGAKVTVIHDAPDGTNINESCGSTHPESLAKAVVEQGADAGLAFDGDADRVMAVTGAGQLVDGDRIIALCARDRADRSRLPGHAVAVTVMSNLGLRRALAAAGIEIVETAVGDRAVLDALEEHGLVLGGEQSGHIIFRDLATTGDGLLSGLHLLDVVARLGRPLDDLAAEAMTAYPQLLRNVRVDGDRARRDEVVAAIGPVVADVEAELGGDGRVLLRPSGTEPVVRVMVEAASPETAAAAVDRLVQAVETAAG